MWMRQGQDAPHVHRAIGANGLNAYDIYWARAAGVAAHLVHGRHLFRRLILAAMMAYLRDTFKVSAMILILLELFKVIQLLLSLQGRRAIVEPEGGAENGMGRVYTCILRSCASNPSTTCDSSRSSSSESA
eukprot:scaffold216813_cov31-Tisochrysis_lutea.AAC.6